MELQEAIPKIVRTVTELPTYLVMAAARFEDQMAREMESSLLTTLIVSPRPTMQIPRYGMNLNLRV